MRSYLPPIACLALLFCAPVAAQVAPSAKRTATAAREASPAGTAPQPAGRQGPVSAAGPKAGWTDRRMFDATRQDLPFIHEVRPLTPGTRSFTAHLTGATYAPLSAAELAALPGLGTPGPEPEIRTGLGISRKQPFAQVDIYPYRRDPATGRVEQLMDYILQLVEEVGAVGHTKANTYPDHSKLASGDWFRFTVPQDGVYKLSYAFLQQLGVDVSGLSSDAINIYGNHAGMLPFKNTPLLPTDLRQNAITVVDGGDGQFGPDDYVLFYASGAQRWERTPGTDRFTHVKNVYSDSASYFVGIDTDLPKRIGTAALTTDPATDQVTAFSDRQMIDKDAVNLLKSGRTWFAEVYDLVTTYNYNFALPFLHTADSLYLTVEVLGRTINATSSFRVQAGSSVTNFNVTGVGTSPASPYGVVKKLTIPVLHTDNNLLVTVTFNKFDPVTSLGYMNYLEVNARRDLKMAGNQLAFRDPRTAAPGRVGEFTLDFAAGVQGIWDITDPTEARAVPFTDNGNQKVFRMATDDLHEFIAFKNTGFLEPTAVGRVAPQDLHGTPLPTDLVIVCPPQFQSQAARLAEARANEGLSVVMVSPQQVFNEFSSGQRDATAIKRYMKMLYDRAGSDPALMPRYLLLFGDGSYNNINLLPSNQNLIPTYQTADSWSSATYTSDDYFGLLDDTEGESPGDLVDIGVGRLPVSDLTQAQQAVDKLLAYDRFTLLSPAGTSCTTGSDGGSGDWRNWVLFCSDDQNGDGFEGDLHMDNSDRLARKVESEHPCLDQTKIYLDAYVQTGGLGGDRYPDAENELRDRVQKGVLVVNYVGHGGETGWAHEDLLDNSTILGWSNLERLPLFMTATCEFSRWDDPARTSAGENVFLNPSGGGIALMTTTRIAFSAQNQTLSMDFYDNVFKQHDEQGRDQRFGDVYRQTKVAISTSNPSSTNHRNFALLGDPTTRLAMARDNAYITAITDTLGNPVDTITALSTVRVNGYVGEGGVPDAGFNGVVVPTVFDKKVTVNALMNDPPGEPFSFLLRKSIIYRGRASVVNGVFSFTFVVPKDINYQVGPGRIGVYAESLTRNACGYTEDPLVGGSNNNVVVDEQGPRIELYLNDERFVPGGITNETPLLYAKLFDDNGINTLGSSIGHDLVATLDANTENAIVLNDVYEADQDTYKSGKVRYRLSKVAEGRHTLDLKAWDVFNNSSQKSTEFVVAPSAELALEHVLNYPNPFTTHTEFYFEHNRPCTTLDCQVQVFTVGGRLVKTLSRRLDCDGFRSEPLAWDGLDDNGDRIGRGVYVYRLSIATPSGESADKFEKLVILR